VVGSDPQGHHPEEVEVFRKAPVVEAILSFQFGPVDNLSDSLRYFADALSNSFARPVERQEKLFPSGYRTTYTIESLDGLCQIRVGRNSFSFHRLPPYSTWADLEAGARATWTEFVRHYAPELISGVSLRYVNHIQLPGGELADYFRLLPQVPKAIDTGSDDFLMRIVLRDPAVPALAEVTQLLMPSRGSLDPIIMFDIDVSITGGEYSDPDGPELWDAVARLREYKNRLFFSSITPAARDLFR
jgi:uncharacterized protein (TIGR04255 family)